MKAAPKKLDSIVIALRLVGHERKVIARMLDIGVEAVARILDEYGVDWIHGYELKRKKGLTLPPYLDVRALRNKVRARRTN